MTRVRGGFGRLLRGLGRRIIHAPGAWSASAYALWPRRKAITAMVRVRNEEEFLGPSVRSIVDVVDRVVVVDNLSEDRTPEITRELVAAYPGRIAAYAYPHAVLRVGKENEHAAARAGSPDLLATYYNYCLRLCRTNFVLKWDGDMIATPAFAAAAAAFRESRRLVLYFRGANVHPDLRHTVGGAGAVSERARGVYDNWTDSFTDFEPRIFPRFRARYDAGFSWCERLVSPFLERTACTHHVRETVYAHLKYCKRDGYANLSPEFAEAVRARLGVGPALEPEVQASLVRWNLAEAQRQKEASS